MAVVQDEASEASPTTDGLTLYGYPQCPFCRRVLNVISDLELEIPLRNTMQDPEHKRAVVAAMGRATVPVLQIRDAAGEVSWLSESADIVRYLKERFGKASGPKAEAADDGLLGWIRKRLGLAR